VVLQDVWVEGEVSNSSRSVTGHLYFTLKDEAASISCVMWKSYAERQAYLPKDGEAAVAHGRISVYEARGTYQLYVDAIQPIGIGILYLRFEELKRRLEAEGLFAIERKRPLPPFPKRLGVVTSPTGAAIRDILHVLGRRYPLTEVIISPTLVQGEEAPSQIVEAIEALNAYADVDAIIVARGGGTIEELWAFNDEGVARAIYESNAPVISGIGHETDFTIADFVADVRAPTPSAAAEIAVPDRGELRRKVSLYEGRLTHLLEARIEELLSRLKSVQKTLLRLSPEARINAYRQRIDELMHQASSISLHRLSIEREGLKSVQKALLRLSPEARINVYRQRIDELMRQAESISLHRLKIEKERLRGIILQLESLSPFATLERGYSITRHLGTGEIIRSVAQVEAGDRIEVMVGDGNFKAEVITKQSSDEL
jgi:exodeoxyribonuclease VII large subunit